ncbi:tetratricopeptide repeat protein [Luteibacter sp.]|uniref:tetratricopeptide repeat protein n=1 Tax=Luteibacter sp. TaxID=1886636 RepID=UPI003F8032D0
MSGRRDPHERTEPTLGRLDDLDKPAPPVDDGLPHLVVDERRPGGAMPPPRSRTPQGPRKRGWLIPVLVLALIGVATALYLQQDRLRNLVPSTELNDTLSQANAALDAGKLDGTQGDSARELFEKARDQQPDSDQARDGLRRVGQAEISRADAALTAGRLDEAEAALNVARELLGGGNDVEQLSQRLSQARNPQQQTDSLVERAQQALAAGKLDGDDGAGPLYRRVLDADRNNAVAARGLDKVGDGLAAQARQAISDNDRAKANAIVDRIAILVPGYGDLPSLRAALAENRKQDDQAVATLVQQGNEAMRAGRFTGEGDDNALARFRAALAADPDNADAKAGLGQVAQALIVQANAAIDSEDDDQANRLLDQAAKLAPKSAELAAARARIAGGGKSTAAASASGGNRLPVAGDDTPAEASMAVSPEQKARVNALVRRAQQAAARGDIMDPPGDSAYDLYRNALSIDGNDASARAGLQGLPGQVETQMQQAVANGNVRRAEDLYATLSDLAPGDAAQGDLRHKLGSAWIDNAVQRAAQGDRQGAFQSLDRARRYAPDDPRLQSTYERIATGR